MAVKQDDLINMWAKPRKMSIWKTQRHPFIDQVYRVCTELQAKSDNRTAVENKRLFTKNSTPLVRMSKLDDKCKKDINAQSYDIQGLARKCPELCSNFCGDDS